MFATRLFVERTMRRQLYDEFLSTGRLVLVPNTAVLGLVKHNSDNLLQGTFTSILTQTVLRRPSAHLIYQA